MEENVVWIDAIITEKPETHRNCQELLDSWKGRNEIY